MVGVQERPDDRPLAAAQFKQAHRPASPLGHPADQTGGGLDGCPLAQVLHRLQAVFPVKIPKVIVFWHSDCPKSYQLVHYNIWKMGCNGDPRRKGEWRGKKGEA